MARVKRKVQKLLPTQKIDKRKSLPQLFKKGNQGRPVGSKNKFTDLRNAFLQAFEGMGGAEELQRWGTLTKNRPMFYSMIAKMLPKEVVLSNPLDSPDALPFTLRIEKAKS